MAETRLEIYTISMGGDCPCGFGKYLVEDPLPSLFPFAIQLCLNASLYLSRRRHFAGKRTADS